MCGVSLYAGSEEYECVKGNQSKKMIVDSTWYGKPITISLYNKDSLSAICKNTQTKIEYLQDTLSKFHCKKDGREILITFTKNAPYELVLSNVTDSKILKVMCRKR